VQVHVAFTPEETAAAPVGIVVDVIRASSTIAQALSAGYERVLCCAEIDEARALRADLEDAVVGGERNAVRIDGFDLGASPREFLQPRASTLILSTTNGTRAILAAASRCEDVVIGSLLNLGAVVSRARAADDDVVILCAGFKGAFALDDAYCAGRIVERLGGDGTDAALAAALVARSFPDAATGLNARTYGPPGLEDDIAFCAQEDVVDVVPRLSGRVGSAVEIRAEPP
jgi:2-phosphosulfolactate phosphatase